MPETSKHRACVGIGLCSALILFVGTARADDVNKSPTLAIGPQYSTTHVYVAPENFDTLVSSLLSVFGGIATPRGVFTVTPTPSKTISQLVLTPVGSFSIFGFQTPIPYPFGIERTGYMVSDLDGAVRAAAANGADVVVAPFDDPIGRDAVVAWPGGVHMQLYWHTRPAKHAALQTIPENRIYVSPERVDAFVKSFLGFSDGEIVADDRQAPGIEIGKAGQTYRRVRLASDFGIVSVAATDGHLPFPYGRELTGYAVADLPATLDKARIAGAIILVEPYKTDKRVAAIVQFPGGYIAEIHASAD